MKKNIYLISTILLTIFALPVFAAPENFKAVVNDVFINGILRPLVPLLVGLAVVVFVYGVLLLMLSEGGEKKEEGKQYMLWGIVGIFVMVSVWGLVAIVSNTFNLDNTARTVRIVAPGGGSGGTNPAGVAPIVD